MIQDSSLIFILLILLVNFVWVINAVFHILCCIRILTILIITQLLTVTELYTMQAAERRQYDVAALLVAVRPDLINARDKRDLPAIDLVKTPDDKWLVLLTP